MDFLKHIATILFLSILVTSCYTDFEPDVASTPVLCMNSLITADEPVAVELTRTWRYSSGTPGFDFDINVPDADVSMYVNGELKEHLEYTDMAQEPEYDGTENTRNMFRSDYAPREGDVVRLVARSDKYGNAEAEVRVPVAVPVDKAEFTAGISGFGRYDYEMSFNMSLDIRLYFTDPGSERNYYELTYRVDNPAPYTGTIDNVTWVDVGGNLNLYGGMDYDSEPLFSEHISVFESVMGGDAYGYTVFTDRQISGKTYPLHVRFNAGAYYCKNPLYRDDAFRSKIEFSLVSVSESYYSWLISQWMVEEGVTGSFGDIGFGDMITVHSNVSTGAGVVAARSIAVYDLELYEFLKQKFYE